MALATLLSDHSDISVDVFLEPDNLVFLASSFQLVLLATNTITSDLSGATGFSSLYGWH